MLALVRQGKEVSEMTVCYWAQPATLTSYETHMSLAASDYENDILHLCESDDWVFFSSTMSYFACRSQKFNGNKRVTMMTKNNNNNSNSSSSNSSRRLYITHNIISSLHSPLLSYPQTWTWPSRHWRRRACGCSLTSTPT